MSRIISVFNPSGHTALIPYITMGYPSMEATLQVVPRLVNSGCDIVELGIPFSDPLADGVTIQKASHQALINGVTPRLCLDMAKQLRQKVTVPLIFMTYFNLVCSYGIEEFCRACTGCGIDGLIIPDLPPEEGAELQAATRRQDIDLIYMLAPTSTAERIKLVADSSRGFIYMVSLTGITGARDKLSAGLEEFVARVRKAAGQPLCIGFGISTPEQAKRVAQIADGVIVGSRIIQLMETDNSLTSVDNLIQDLRQALDNR